jgi:hypothetical protein
LGWKANTVPPVRNGEFEIVMVRYPVSNKSRGAGEKVLLVGAV